MAAPADNADLVAAHAEARRAADAIWMERDRLVDLKTRVAAAEPNQVLTMVSEVLRDVRPGLNVATGSIASCLTFTPVAPSFDFDPPGISRYEFDRLYHKLLTQLPSPLARTGEQLCCAISSVRLLFSYLLERCAKFFDVEHLAPQRAGMMDQALTYLDGVCTIADLAVTCTNFAIYNLAASLTMPSPPRLTAVDPPKCAPSPSLRSSPDERPSPPSTRTSLDRPKRTPKPNRRYSQDERTSSRSGRATFGLDRPKRTPKLNLRYPPEDWTPSPPSSPTSSEGAALQD